MRDLTQEDAATELGMARTTLVAIEKGQRRLRPEQEIVATHSAVIDFGVDRQQRRPAERYLEQVPCPKIRVEKAGRGGPGRIDDIGSGFDIEPDEDQEAGESLHRARALAELNETACMLRVIGHRPFDRFAPHRFGEHVVADGRLVGRVERLEQHDRRAPGL